MNGLALTILVGQLPKLFGFKVEAEGLIGEITGFVKGLAHGEAVAGRGCGRDRRDRADPGAAALAAQSPGRADRGGARDRGDHGLPTWPTTASAWSGCSPRVSRRSRSRMSAWPISGPCSPGALGIALVSLADTISTASAFAARTGQEVRGNGEMIGIGAANLAAGLFQGFPVSTSGSRTAVAERSGAQDPAHRRGRGGPDHPDARPGPGPVPEPAAARARRRRDHRIAVAGRHPGTVRLWRQRKAEFLLSIAAFLGVALLGVLPGIAVAVGAVHPQRLPPGLAALRHGTRTGRRTGGLTTT